MLVCVEAESMRLPRSAAVRRRRMARMSFSGLPLGLPLACTSPEAAIFASSALFFFTNSATQ